MAQTLPNLYTGVEPPKSSPDMKALFTTWRNTGDNEALGGLLDGMKPAIDAALRSYANGDERLRVRANMLATDALKTWDPAKGQMNTHLLNSLQRLRRVSAERSTALDIPENVRMDNLTVRRFIADFKDQNGRDPDHMTIAEKLGMTQKRVKKALSSGEDAQTTVTNRLGFEPGLVKRDPRDVWRDYVYHDLDPAGRYIMERAMGYNGVTVEPKHQIAAALKISPAAVSQRISTINKKVAEIDQLPNPEALN